MNETTEEETTEGGGQGGGGGGGRSFHDFLWAKKILCEHEVDTYSQTEEEGFCPPIWDGAMCWQKIRAGVLAFQPCAEYIPTFDPMNFASKQCELDSKWAINPTSNSTWTNYSLCIRPGDGPKLVLHVNHTIIYEWLPVVKKTSQIGYAVSFVALLLALTILCSIKKLRCPRNTLHMHLFASFTLRAFMALLKAQLFINGIGLPGSIIHDDVKGPMWNHEKANWECKLVTSIWQYAMVANYSWILIEGLYLYNLIFLAPFSDSSAITLYICLGWGCPLLVVASWVMARIYVDNTLCWTTHDNNNHLFLIIRIPIIISIVLNFMFFLNIVRVLLLKLQSSQSAETRKYRKWAKSTLVLVPLFGVHYMVFIGMSYYIGKDQIIEVVWLFCDQLFASFQGFFVSVLYCILNGEVRSELKKIWKNWRIGRDYDRNKDGRNSLPLRQVVSSRFRSNRKQQEVTNVSSFTVRSEDVMTNGLTLT